MDLVIFDCDGTLVDSQHNIVAAKRDAFARHGLQAPAYHDLLGAVGLSHAEAFRLLAPDQSEGQRASLADAYRTAFSSGRLARVDEPLYPGIAETIRQLQTRDDILLGIATGKSQRGVRRLLEREGWQGMFRTIQTADEHPSKPNPAMIRAAMAEAGVGPDATLMIGDTSFDMAMARAAQVGALGVAWGYHPPSALHEAGAHEVVVDGETLVAAITNRLAQQRKERSA
jgi:phosphoglycolate phosphatase